MAMDCVRLVYEHLILFGGDKNTQKIDLFIHSNGGDGIVPWRLVTLIREFTKAFSVLVPHRAFSAATLTALGANKIVMHPMGMLGPTDPTVRNPFNPDSTDPLHPGKVGISVEDVTAYLALIKEEAGIHHEDELIEGFKILADKVHPLALGNVKRFLSQSRAMARKLLSLHMDVTKEKHQIDEIVDNITSKLYYHGHPINRVEAREDIRLNTVESAQAKVEDLMWKLYLEYEALMELDKPFNPVFQITTASPNLPIGQSVQIPPQKVVMAAVESADRSDINSMEYSLFGAKMPPSGDLQVGLTQLGQGWNRLR